MRNNNNNNNKSFEEENISAQKNNNNNNGKRKYIKSGKYTKDAILDRRIGKTLNRYNKIPDEELSWFQELKQEITNIFFKKEEPKFELDKQALGVTKRFVIDLKKNGLSLHDPWNVLKKVKPLVLEKFKENPNTKQQLTLQCKMEKKNPATNESIIENPYFHSRQRQIFEASDFDEIFENMEHEILVNFETWVSEGSRWVFESSLKIIQNINTIKILKGSSYIPLSKKLKDKKAIINPKNKDQKCLLWCLAIHEILKNNPNFKDPQRIPKILKKKIETFNTSGMEFPCSLSDVCKFENNNNIGINVFGYEEEEILPLRASEKKCDNVVNVLLIEKYGNKHFCLIKSMSKLVSSQCSKNGHKIYICNYCLHEFRKEENLKEHVEYCRNFKCGKKIFPKKGEILKFKNYERMHNVPYLIYADFEACLKPIHKQKGKNTILYQKHEPSGYCYIIINCFDKDDVILRQYTKKSENQYIAKHFIDSLEKDVKEIYKTYKFPKRIIMDKQDEEDFGNATQCHACEKEFKNGMKKIKDHCHFTGKYRGASCINCNSKMKLPKFIPVVFNNLQNYDSHLFIKAMGDRKGKINCIPKTEEKYISFSKDIIVDKFEDEKILTKKQYQKKKYKQNMIEFEEEFTDEKNQIKYRIKETVFVKRQLRFIDSYKFMALGLAKLVKYSDSNELYLLKKFFPLEEERSLLTQKGVFPYHWLIHIKKLEEENLPPIEEFYNTLNGENISFEDYARAQKIWKKFQLKSMREYHDLYLKLDVILLADVL